MTTTIDEPTVTYDIPPFPVRRFSVDEYHRIIDSGALEADEPLELWEGWIVPKMTRKPPHDVAVVLASDALRAQLPHGWHVRIQAAITTADSEVEPDIAIVRGLPRDYLACHPAPSQIGIAVEIADSSLNRDRFNKARVYARAGVSTYWIVNLVDAIIEAYTSPSGPRDQPSYQSRRDYRTGDSVPLTIDGRDIAAIAVSDVLP